MTKRSLRTLYRHAAKGDKIAQVELDNAKKMQLDKFVERYERLSIILEHRNLTLSEANLLYTSGVKVSALSPRHGTEDKASERNYKSTVVRSYTNRYRICPCCEESKGSNHMVWYVKDGFIKRGFLKICRACKWKYDTHRQGQCISVYYGAYMAMCAGCPRELAMQVYKVYLDKGVVFNRTSASRQGIANFNMRQVINLPDDMAARDKDQQEYEEYNCSWEN